jgi:hypothetical protein
VFQTGLSSGSDQFAVFIVATVGCALAANAMGTFIVSIAPSAAIAFTFGGTMILLFNLLLGTTIVSHPP